jgi:hypothetical protein
LLNSASQVFCLWQLFHRQGMQHQAEAQGNQVQAAPTRRTNRQLSRALSQARKVQTRKRQKRLRKRRQKLLNREKKPDKAVEAAQKNSAGRTIKSAREEGMLFFPLLSWPCLYC